MRRFLKFSLGCAALAALVVPAAAMAGGSGGVSGPSFYVDGSLYRTVGTPTDLSNTGAPDSSFETIYDGFMDAVRGPFTRAATALSAR